MRLFELELRLDGCPRNGVAGRVILHSSFTN